ncbi:protein I'm not dead yet-like [Maniola hyperantus]|uniref:protein I'm not dead yet-like n=1 Tax=Aphantopus hyperantus TaxID=2795564 RepID=UPI00156853B3|nr:protein I'm not dead yet-like [Maniola hyperantus]
MENVPSEVSVPAAASDNVPEKDEENANAPDDVPRLTIKEKLRLFLRNHWRGIFCFVVPFVLIPIQLSFPPEKYQWCAYTLVLMAVFWVAECIPLAVTSFLPIVIFPLTGIMSTSETCACYMNDTIMMFLGSMWLAYAVEQSGLHMRLAVCAIRCVGYSHYKLLFAMSFITMFISMWITNTAATTMMVPINFALLKVFEDHDLLKVYDTGVGENVASDITTCYFCAATFSATIGGIGTLVGTATNFVFKGLFTRMYPNAPEYLSFPKFAAFAIPYMLIMEICVYLYLIVLYFGFLRPHSAAAKNAKMPIVGIEAAKKAVEEKYKALGRITIWEILVIILFSIAILLFFCRSPQIFTGWGDAIPEYFHIKDKKFVKDSAAAAIVVFFMILLPSSLTFFENYRAKHHGDLPDKSIPSVLDWKKLNEVMPYSFMFLLGGGFALSEAAKKEYTDLNGKIGMMLKHFKHLPNLITILLVITFTVFTTNFASNVAVCTVIAPIVMQLAKEINENPLWYNIAAGFSSSYAFCLPVGTPGNLVVQSAANIPTSKMIKAGIGPTVTTIIITWFCVCFWAPVVWPDLKSLPDWIE